MAYIRVECVESVGVFETPTPSPASTRKVEKMDNDMRIVGGNVEEKEEKTVAPKKIVSKKKATARTPQLSGISSDAIVSGYWRRTIN